MACVFRTDACTGARTDRRTDARTPRNQYAPQHVRSWGHNYTKFSATEAPFCIKLRRCGLTPKVWKQKIWWAVSVSNMHPPPSTIADAIRETPQPQTSGKRLLPKLTFHGRQASPTWPTKHNSRGLQGGDVWCNKNLQIDKKPKEWKPKSTQIHVTLTSQS